MQVLRRTAGGYRSTARFAPNLERLRQSMQADCAIGSHRQASTARGVRDLINHHPSTQRQHTNAYGKREQR